MTVRADESELRELRSITRTQFRECPRVMTFDESCAFRRSRPLIPTDRDQLFRSIATSGRGCVRAPLDAFSDVSVGVPRQAWDWSLRSAPGSSVSALPAWILRIDGPSSAEQPELHTDLQNIRRYLIADEQREMLVRFLGYERKDVAEKISR